MKFELISFFVFGTILLAALIAYLKSRNIAKFFRDRRIMKLRVQLAGLEAQMLQEKIMAKATGQIYPVFMSIQSQRIAEAQEELRILEAKNYEHRVAEEA